MRRSVAESAVREVHHKSVVLGLDGNSPLGFTSCVLIDESHVTAHCYSDRGWLAVDVFTCGSNAQMPRVRFWYHRSSPAQNSRPRPFLCLDFFAAVRRIWPGIFMTPFWTAHQTYSCTAMLSCRDFRTNRIVSGSTSRGALSVSLVQQNPAEF